MVRKELFMWVELLARRDYTTLTTRLKGRNGQNSRQSPPGEYSIPAERHAWGAIDLEDSTNNLEDSTHNTINPKTPAWNADDLEDAMADYWAEHEWIGIDAEARASRWATIDETTRLATQTLVDPLGYCEWVLNAEIDLLRVTLPTESRIAATGDPQTLNISYWQSTTCQH